MKWRQEMIVGTNVVRPLDDIIPHTTTDACPCGPRVELIGFSCYDHNKLTIARQIIHQAMDNREDWNREEGDES